MPSGQGLLSAGENIKGTVDLTASSSNVNLKILDPVTGDIVATRHLGDPAAGSVPFVWDGVKDNGNPAAPGVYKVQVEAGIDGINTVLQPNIQARVESVSMGTGSNGIQLNLSGLGAVNFNQIKQIL